jgi:uncharacterized protein (TIGR02284 family)
MGETLCTVGGSIAATCVPGISDGHSDCCGGTNTGSGGNAMTDQEINDYLGGLIDATRDSEAAFHAAAGQVRGDEARALLLDRARRYGRATAALRALADERGLQPDPRASAEPTPRIAPPDDAAILAESERKESAVIFAYCDALERPLPPPAQEVIAGELERLLASLGTLRAARDRAARQRRLVVGRRR